MEEMTVLQVIKSSIDDLNKINIPLGKFDEYGRPILTVLDKLRACVEAIERAEKEIANKTEEAPEITIEPISDDELPNNPE